MGLGELKWEGRAGCHALYEVSLAPSHYPSQYSPSLCLSQAPTPSFPEPSLSWDAAPRPMALAGPLADLLATQRCTWLGISLELGIKVTGLRDC